MYIASSLWCRWKTERRRTLLSVEDSSSLVIATLPNTLQMQETNRNWGFFFIVNCMHDVCRHKLRAKISASNILFSSSLSDLPQKTQKQTNNNNNIISTSNFTLNNVWILHMTWKCPPWILTDRRFESFRTFHLMSNLNLYRQVSKRNLHSFCHFFNTCKLTRG